MDQARALVELQAVDLTLVRLTKQLDEMPEKRSILQARQKIAEIRDLKRRTDAALHAIDGGIARLEDEVAGVAHKIDEEQARLLSGDVRSPKELQAISLELDSLKRRMDQLENDELGQMQKRETALAQASKVDAAVDTGTRTEAALTERFKTRGGDILANIEAANLARAALLAQLPPELRERYETMRSSKHGIAVGVLEDEMCSACRVSLPSSCLQSLEDGPDIGACPSCNRILIVRGAAGE
jgi:hypothetical protein